MISQKIKKIDFSLSFDDYHPDNINIANICESYGFKATFFIDFRERQEAEIQVKKLFKKGHEIGGHTLNHYPDLKKLPIEEARGEIEVGKKIIEGITGKECASFAYPRGRFNDDIVELVKSAGFLDARTTHVLKTHFDDQYRMPTTIHILNGRREYKERVWLKEALNYFMMALNQDVHCMFHIWGHAFEINRDNYWLMLDSFLEQIVKYRT